MIWNRTFMFVSMVVAMLVLTLAAPDGAAAGEGGEKGPRIEITEPVYDFGEIFRGTKVHHSFTITNAGDEELTIGEPDPDCGCTTANVTRKSLLPGESMQIEVGVNSITLEQGELEKSVRIATNDPGEPEAIVTMKGSVNVAVNVSPSQIRLGGYKPGELIPEQIVKLTPMEGYDLNVKHVESNGKLVKARMLESDGSDTVRIAVSIDSHTRRRTLPAAVNVYTGINDEPLVRIPIFVGIDQPYTIAPYTITFKNVRNDFEGKLAYNVLLRNYTDEPLIVNEIKSNSEFVACELKTVEDGKKYRLNVAVLPGFPPAGFNSTVEIHTNSEMYPVKVVTVEVKGIKGAEGSE